MRYYAPELINKHQGETAFICGAGPSFFDIYQSYKFVEIFKHVVISVNSTIIVMPWKEGGSIEYNPDKSYWISNDSLCRRWSWWQDVKKANCIKIVRDSWKKYEDELSDFLYFSPRSTKEDEINPEEERLAYCSSVPSALDLAIQMGCKTIYLLGVDHRESHGYRHFWELLPLKMRPTSNVPAQGPWSQQEQVFEINKLAFKALHDFAKNKGVKVINCETWIESDIKEFDKEYFEALFNKEKKCLQI